MDYSLSISVSNSNHPHSNLRMRKSYHIQKQFTVGDIEHENPHPSDNDPLLQFTLNN